MYNDFIAIMPEVQKELGSKPGRNENGCAFSLAFQWTVFSLGARCFDRDQNIYLKMNNLLSAQNHSKCGKEPG